MEIKLPNSNISCKTLTDLLRYRSETTPNKIVYTFLADGENQRQTMTYAELDQRAKAIAADLQSKNIAQNETAVLIYPPGLDLIAGFFGCLYAGVIAVLTYPPANIRFLEKLYTIIEEAKPKIILSNTEFVKEFQKLKMLQVIDKIPLLKTFLKRLVDNSYLNVKEIFDLSWSTTDQLSSDLARSWNDPSITEEQIAFLQFTSGSTAKPKGVVLLHKNLLHNSYLSYQGFGFNAEDIIGSWLPPYHDMGLIGSMLQPLYADIPCFLISPYHFLQKPLRWLHLVTHFKATVSGGPNFAYEYCAKKITKEQKVSLDLSHWQVAFNGAEPIRHRTMERFYQAFRECGFKKTSFLPCYGLAEATLYVSSTRRNEGFNTTFVNAPGLRKNKMEITTKSDPHATTIVSCGKPLVNLAIVNPDTHIICAENEIGEIWINGPSVAKGYWQKKEETKKFFHAHVSNDNSNSSYLRTGDLGVMHHDELYITGRLKDMIIIHGVNHFPQDIEFTLGDCHPLIRSGSCAAFTVVQNGEDELVIVCEIKPIFSGKEEIFPEICQVAYRAVILHHEIPAHEIILVQQKTLAKTTSGKIRRRYTKEQMEANKLKIIYKWKHP